jgi:hypothetical protein
MERMENRYFAPDLTLTANGQKGREKKNCVRAAEAARTQA